MLRSHVKGLHSYTAVWKILDWLLQHKNIKADLVQLCGYYQYVPAFKAVLKVHKKGCLSSSAMETFLQSVCNDDLTKRSVHILDMSNDKKATKQQLTLFLKELKEMGYEVRSSRTNLSIDNESYLIPYAFPTLSPQSVQLNKKL